MWQQMRIIPIVLLCALFVGCVDELQRGTTGGSSTSAWSDEKDRGSQREQQDSRTGSRVALIIGNGDYQDINHLPKLRNPINDAEDFPKPCGVLVSRS